MEHRVANVVASLIGDGYSGTGFNGRTAEQAGRDGGGVKGKVWVVASVVRRGEKNVCFAPQSSSLSLARADVSLRSTNSQ